MATLIQTAKMNDVDPQAWLAVLARVAGHPVHRLHELLPWTWRSKSIIAIAASPPDDASGHLEEPIFAAGGIGKRVVTA